MTVALPALRDAPLRDAPLWDAPCEKLFPA